jgi:hypothetical protein
VTNPWMKSMKALVCGRTISRRGMTASMFFGRTS